MQKGNLKELLKNNIISIILLIIIISTVAVFAGDIIVKEGEVEAENLNISGNITASCYIDTNSDTKIYFENGYLVVEG